MSQNIKKMYRCGQCLELHTDEHDAEYCCPTDADEVFVCTDCDTPHENYEEAGNCCSEKKSCPKCARIYAKQSINYQAIQTVNHCTVCNPLFSLDQQALIEDLHYQATGCIGSVTYGSSEYI